VTCGPNPWQAVRQDRIARAAAWTNEEAASVVECRGSAALLAASEWGRQRLPTARSAL